MRMTLYYMGHSFVNQLKKLCRTWVALFLLACFALGLVIGLGAAALTSLFEEENPEDTVIEETLPAEGEEEPVELDAETALGLAELVAGGLVLAVLVFGAMAADKSGGSIFLMADVNLLFPAPIKPQTVLLFRLIMQAGASFGATIYILFQIPNLINSLGLNAGMVLAIMAAWFLMLIYTKLISVLLYTVCTTYEKPKRYLRPVLWGSLAVIGGAYYLYARTAENFFVGALGFFNGPYTRYIPVWGWLKGLVGFALEGDPLGALLCLAALLLFAVLLVFIIWHIKADFYEDAMMRSAETAEKLAQAQAGKASMQKRKKDRADKLRRDGLNKGYGATVYFHKAMYNRFRFAYFRVFTKTSITYLLTALGLSAFMMLIVEASFFPVVPLVLGGFAFFRSLGNPIAQDTDHETFFLIPDSPRRKVFFSFAAGIVNSMMDLLPGFLVGAVLLRANPLEALVWFLLVISLGAYSDGIALFLDLSISTGISQMAKGMIQILFVYFGLAPAAVLIILGFALNQLMLFAALTVLLNLLIAAASLLLSPMFVENGRK